MVWGLSMDPPRPSDPEADALTTRLSGPVNSVSAFSSAARLGPWVSYPTQILYITLRKPQALPNRTSNAAVLLLLGALPLEAELDKRHLSLLFSCLKSGNTKLVLLAERQSLYYDSEGRSFFTRVKKILSKYELPDMDSICEMDISKEQWKIKTKTAVKKYWSETLL